MRQGVGYCSIWLLVIWALLENGIGFRSIQNTIRIGRQNVNICKVAGNGDYLARMVQRKKAEVDNLLRRHQSLDDPLFMRMTYVNAQCKYEVAKALKKPNAGPDEQGKMSLIVDVKRKSPTIPTNRDVVDYTNAGEFCQLLAQIEVDGFLLNTEPEYGGKFQDLKESRESLKRLGLETTPPLIHKDLIIHPIQVCLPHSRFRMMN